MLCYALNHVNCGPGHSTDMPKKLLVVRQDKLGDFMLTLPAFALLKKALPDTEIHALISPMVLEIARELPAIDEVLLDPGEAADWATQRAFFRELRQHRFDAAVTLFSTSRIGFFLFAARVPYRLAPATKIAQLFHNRRLVQRRSQSRKSEWQYNLDLSRRCLEDHAIVPPTAASPPFLSFPADEREALRVSFCRERGLDPKGKLVFLHPGSGGSAANLAPDQFATLLRELHQRSTIQTVISAGPGEEPIAERVAVALEGLPNTVYKSQQGLARFARHLDLADLFISGSTGPLHIAGALDRPTAAFYPRRRSASPLRWQTLNRPERRLAFTPPENEDERAMHTIDLPAAAQTIAAQWLGGSVQGQASD